MGNPCLQGTWQDEAINKRVRDLAASLHSHTFERRLLTQINAGEGPQGSRAFVSRKRKHVWEEEEEPQD